MIILETHIVPEGVENIRFSDYGLRAFPVFPSRKSFIKAIKKGEFLLDGDIATTARFMKSGQIIQLIDLEETLPKIYKLKLEKIYEDDFMAVILKPAGIDVSGNKFRTVANALPYNLVNSTQSDALKYPRPVHRLDNPTSGLLLVAKTKRILTELGDMLAERKIAKRYRAVVIGDIPDEGVLLTSVNGKEAKSHYKKVCSVSSLKSKVLSLLDLWLETGRTHQLRIQLSDAGYPILGDKLYGKPDLILKGKGLFLSAVELKLQHPFTKEMLNINIDQPDKFSRYMNAEARRFEYYSK